MNLARLRYSRSWTQTQVGERLAVVVGKDPSDGWSGATVAHAEHGRRAFRVSDLLLFALAFEVPIGSLLVIPLEVANVSVGDYVLNRRHLEDPRWLHETSAAGLAELASALMEVSRRAGALQEDAHAIQEITTTFGVSAHRLRHQISLEEKGAAETADYERSER